MRPALKFPHSLNAAEARAQRKSENQLPSVCRGGRSLRTKDLLLLSIQPVHGWHAPVEILKSATPDAIGEHCRSRSLWRWPHRDELSKLVHCKTSVAARAARPYR